jgi:hypothetical protein
MLQRAGGLRLINDVVQRTNKRQSASQIFCAQAKPAHTIWSHLRPYWMQRAAECRPMFTA